MYDNTKRNAEKKRNWDSKSDIPLFEDVLKVIGDTPINIEFKNPNDRVITETYDLLKKYDKTASTIWGTYKSKYTPILNKTDTEMARYATFEEVSKLIIYYYLGMLPFTNFDCDYIQIPFPSKTYLAHLKQTNGDNWQTNLYFKLLQVHSVLMRPAFRHMKKRGVKTMMWVVNEEEDVDHMMS